MNDRECIRHMWLDDDVCGLCGRVRDEWLAERIRENEEEVYRLRLLLARRDNLLSDEELREQAAELLTGIGALSAILANAPIE